MELTSTLSVSVRDLVEFVMRSGSIDSTFTTATRAVEGTKAHQKLQRESRENYKAEVYVSHIVNKNNISMEINGRIDGVISTDEGIIIDEIKTTTADLEYIDENFNPRHLAQAKCYGYIYAVQNNLDRLKIRLTYFNIENKEVKYIINSYNKYELGDFFEFITDKYIEWAQYILNCQRIRNDSIEKLKFPFEQYRIGQRELAVAVYKTLRDENKLFSQAPTGTGKTMAVLFPAIKALGQGITSKIFYLTSKTITRTVAEETLHILSSRGLKIKRITLTAKEKICFNSGAACRAGECEYANGHFDRVNDAIRDILENDFLNRETIESYAVKHKVCPFEFSLDLSLFCDIVICDYNYVFDPTASLKRFFSESKTDYIFLIDEAHNMVDRGREMFSAELYKKPFLDFKRAFKDIVPELSKAFGKVNEYFIALRKKLAENTNKPVIQKEIPEEISKILEEVQRHAEKWLAKNQKNDLNKELIDLYFEILDFLRAMDNYDANYCTYILKENNDIKIKLLCINPSKLLREGMNVGRASILFSATLSPMDYYRDILGGDEGSYKISLPSPFPGENLCVIVDDSISTKYINRELSYDNIAEDIKIFIKRKGNYLVFFPSYKYMEEVYKRLENQGEALNIVCQKTGMTEEEKVEFIENFKSDPLNSFAGFAVMGGMFGEGIDLSGDRLTGAVIVGVGLPQVNIEREIIKQYFQETRNAGFEYSYIYPGMNRVTQAVGRLIRTENDRGVALLIDERFSTRTYRNLFPREWLPVKKIRNFEDIERFAEEFWNKK